MTRYICRTKTAAGERGTLTFTLPKGSTDALKVAEHMAVRFTKDKDVRIVSMRKKRWWEFGL